MNISKNSKVWAIWDASIVPQHSIGARESIDGALIAIIEPG